MLGKDRLETIKEEESDDLVSSNDSKEYLDAITKKVDFFMSVAVVSFVNTLDIQNFLLKYKDSKEESVTKLNQLYENFINFIKEGNIALKPLLTNFEIKIIESRINEKIKFLFSKLNRDHSEIEKIEIFIDIMNTLVASRETVIAVVKQDLRDLSEKQGIQDGDMLIESIVNQLKALENVTQLLEKNCVNASMQLLKKKDIPGSSEKQYIQDEDVTLELIVAQLENLATNIELLESYLNKTETLNIEFIELLSQTKVTMLFAEHLFIEKEKKDKIYHWLKTFDNRIALLKGHCTNYPALYLKLNNLLDGMKLVEGIHDSFHMEEKDKTYTDYLKTLNERTDSLRDKLNVLVRECSEYFAILSLNLKIIESDIVRISEELFPIQQEDLLQDSVNPEELIHEGEEYKDPAHEKDMVACASDGTILNHSEVLPQVNKFLQRNNGTTTTSPLPVFPDRGDSDDKLAKDCEQLSVEPLKFDSANTHISSDVKDSENESANDHEELSVESLKFNSANTYISSDGKDLDNKLPNDLQKVAKGFKFGSTSNSVKKFLFINIALFSFLSIAAKIYHYHKLMFCALTVVLASLIVLTVFILKDNISNRNITKVTVDNLIPLDQQKADQAKLN